MSLNLDFSFYYILFCLIIALFFSYFLYRNEKNIFRKTYIIFIFFTFFKCFLICLLLSNPILNTVAKSFEKPIVIVAQDVSKSISEDVFDDLKALENYDKDFDVRLFLFQTWSI